MRMPKTLSSWLVIVLAVTGLLVLASPSQAGPCSASVYFSNISASSDFDGRVTVTVSGLVSTPADQVRVFVALSRGTLGFSATTQIVDLHPAINSFSLTVDFGIRMPGRWSASTSITPLDGGKTCGSTVNQFTSVQVPAPLGMNLFCNGGVDEPEFWCFANPSGGSGSYSVQWDTSGIDDLDEAIVDGDEINLLLGSCSPYDAIEVTVRDTVSGRSVFDWQGLTCDVE